MIYSFLIDVFGGVVCMEYIAHKDGERIQTVKEHLYGTAELAGSFAEKFGKKEWGYCCGMLHDLGKYSKEFQRKIQNACWTSGLRKHCDW